MVVPVGGDGVGPGVGIGIGTAGAGTRGSGTGAGTGAGVVVPMGATGVGWSSSTMRATSARDGGSPASCWASR